MQEPSSGGATYKFNANRSVAVSTDTFWDEDMTACPRGCKVQLLGAGGVAAYGEYKGEAFWIKWAPVPRNRPRASENAQEQADDCDEANKGQT